MNSKSLASTWAPTLAADATMPDGPGMKEMMQKMDDMMKTMGDCMKMMQKMMSSMDGMPKNMKM